MATIYMFIMALRIAVKCLGFSGLVKKSAQLSVDEGDRDALLLDELADEEVSSRDVLSLGVELGVVGDAMPAWLSIASAVGAGSV